MSESTEAIGNGRRSWSLGLLFIVGALNLFDRQVINVLAQDIKIELGLSDARLGLLTGTAFGLFYAVLGLPLARLADRVDRVRLIAGMVAVWSAFTIVCGLAGNFLVLFIGRMGVGVGEAGSQPASTALIPDFFPERRRTSALSLLLVGAPVGSFLGLMVGGLVAQHWGWRAAFVVAGVPGLVIAAVMMMTMRDPRSGNALDRRFEGSFWAALAELGMKSEMRWLCAGMTASTFLIYASSAWLPAFFIRLYGFTTAEIGFYAALGVGVGGGLGTLSTGIVCDLIRPHVANPESKVLIALFVTSIPALLATTLTTSLSVALPAMFLFDICAFAWLGPMTRIVQRAAGPAHHALAMALCSAFATIVSLSAGLPLVGLLSDHLAPEAGTRALGEALAMTIPVAACLAIVSNISVMRKQSRGNLDVPD